MQQPFWDFLKCPVSVLGFLNISKEAYALSWNTQNSLKELSNLLGGNPYELMNLETNLKNILKYLSNQEIQTDDYGNYLIDKDGNFIFQEVEDG